MTDRWTMKTLNKLKADDLMGVANSIKMKPGHAAKFRDYLRREQSA